MKLQTKDVYFATELISDFGSRGQCFRCKKGYEETAMIDAKPFCRNCVLITFPDNNEEFKRSDLKFYCPFKENKCGVRNLSVVEYLVGICCDNATRWTSPGPHGNFLNWLSLNKIYAEARKQEYDSVRKTETADKVVETCQSLLIHANVGQNMAAHYANLALEEAKKEAKSARDELEKKKIWRRKVQTRTLRFAEIAMKEDNPEVQLERENENEPGSVNLDESNDGHETCKVCFERFDQGQRQKAAINPCGHLFCVRCLTSLHPQTCPTCRAPFTADKILKLYP